MSSSSIPADGRSDYLGRLATIREDPKVRNLARARAGDPELAEDALQDAYFALARVDNPEHIEDLRAYYCRVLLRTIHRLRSQLGAILIEDFAAVADNCQRKPGGEPPPPLFDKVVDSYLDIQDLLRYFATHRGGLSLRVPGRSPDPGRYRDVIVTVAECVLRASVAGGLSEAEQNQAFRALYPQRFAEDGVSASNIHQRFARARTDVHRLLQHFIKRRDLYF